MRSELGFHRSCAARCAPIFSTPVSEAAAIASGNFGNASDAGSARGHSFVARSGFDLNDFTDDEVEGEETKVNVKLTRARKTQGSNRQSNAIGEGAALATLADVEDMAAEEDPPIAPMKGSRRGFAPRRNQKNVRCALLLLLYACFSFENAPRLRL